MMSADMSDKGRRHPLRLPYAHRDVRRRFKDVSAVELGTVAVREALARAGLPGDRVDEVVLGCVLQAGIGMNPARQVAIKAGLPESTPAVTVNKVCGSGLKAVVMAAQAVKCGDAEVVVAGGAESMTRAPYLLPGARWGERLGHGRVLDHMIHEGLTDAFHDIHMGVTAENLVERYGIARAEQDAFAAGSQARAVAAIAAGAFKDEIVPVALPARKGEAKTVDTDEHPRAGTTVESLGRLKAAFKEGGSVTAGNASGLNDGAAALVIASAGAAEAEGVKPIGRIVAYASAAVDPRVMGIGPVPAVRKALARAGAAHRRDRSLRAQRGVRRAEPGRAARPGARPGEGERERRRHRTRPPDRRLRRAHPGDAAPRAPRPVAPLRRRRALHRGRAGHRPRGREAVAVAPFVGAAGPHPAGAGRALLGGEGRPRRGRAARRPHHRDRPDGAGGGGDGAAASRRRMDGRPAPGAGAGRPLVPAVRLRPASAATATSTTSCCARRSSTSTSTSTTTSRAWGRPPSSPCRASPPAGCRSGPRSPGRRRSWWRTPAPGSRR
jgi:acetyl-CoA C-acetyltransferase